MTTNPAVQRMADDAEAAAERVDSNDIEFVPTYIGMKYIHDRVTIEIAFVEEKGFSGEETYTIVDEENAGTMVAYVLRVDGEIVYAIDVSEEMGTTVRIFNSKIQERGA